VSGECVAIWVNRSHYDTHRPNGPRMGTVRIQAALLEGEAGRPIQGSSAGSQRHSLGVAHRRPLARPAGAVREMEDLPRPAAALAPPRGLGAGASGPAGRSGRRRGSRLDGGLDRRRHGPGPSARGRSAPHAGHGRAAGRGGKRGKSRRPTRRSVAVAAGSAPSCTSPPKGAVGRWWSA
jgi:hypothetical protein